MQAEQSAYPQSLIRAELHDADLATLLSPTLDDGFVAQLAASASTAYQARLIRQPLDVAPWLERADNSR